MNTDMRSEDFQFEWDRGLDRAQLRAAGRGLLWEGSLLPTLQVRDGGVSKYLRANVDEKRMHDGWEALSLRFDETATGVLMWRAEATGVRFKELSVRWTGEALPVMGLYFGLSPLENSCRAGIAADDGPEWPDWRAEGFCVPGAKGNPGQSFWRSWDMGHAVLPLGSFGPSMGTPYAAAFPRPLLAAAMGGAGGWMAFGPGAVPASALSLEIRAASACVHYLMREDLWGAPEGHERVWEEPLRLAWASEAWDAFARLFATFDSSEAARPEVQRSQWGTWGDFKEGRFDLARQLDIARSVGAAEVVIDDYWETWSSSGVVNAERFPRFIEETQAMAAEGVQPALWQSIGWVDRPEEVGLEAADLLCRADGSPCLANWGCDPRSTQPKHYCLDPSSANARAFLVQRTKRQMRDYRPKMLKLDFGYGMPGPETAAPRDPDIRGERLCVTLLDIIRNAAREIDPEVAVQYYGIHPLMRPHYDLLSLDDLGDMGFHEAAGHGQRSVWAALAAPQRVAMMAASGYYWGQFEEMLLNAAVLGAPGGCLPERDASGETGTRRILCRFRALSKWHRRTVGWDPVWLNSHKGSIEREPELACWGRQERGGKLPALVLRDPADGNHPDLSRWGVIGWCGRWALISQDDEEIGSSARVAIIPFDAGTIELDWPSGVIEEVRCVDGRANMSAVSAFSSQIRVADLTELDALMGFEYGNGQG